VREGYHELAALDPQRWVLIDAAQSPQKIQQELRAIIMSRLEH